MLVPLPPPSTVRSRGAHIRKEGRSMARSSFKLEHPLERRQAEANRIREKYNDRIPVIVEKAGKSDIPDIDKKKICFPGAKTKLPEDKMKFRG